MHGSFDPAAATQAYVATMSPAAQAKAIAYTHQQHWLLLGGAAVGVLVALLILKSGLLRRAQAALEARRARPALTSFLLPLLFLVLSSLLFLPWSAYAGWWVERGFAMTSQPFTGWLSEYLISATLSSVFGAMLFCAIYALIRRAGRAWPLFAGAVVLVFAGMALVAGPIYIEPLFNTYTPAPNGPVRDAVVQLAKANAVPSDKIFIYNGSKQSNRYTANVSGLFGSARVAMSDVMFAKGADISEVRGVVGHEMGHYVHQHALWMVAEVGALAVLLFWLADIVFPMCARWMGARGVGSITDPAGFPVVMAIMTVLQLVTTPVMNSFTRYTEADADRFSLARAHEPDGLSKALIKTADYRAPSPGRIEEILFYDHPSVSWRIRQAMNWKTAHLDISAAQAQQDAAIAAGSDPAQAPATATK